MLMALKQANYESVTIEYAGIKHKVHYRPETIDSATGVSLQVLKIKVENLNDQLSRRACFSLLEKLGLMSLTQTEALDILDKDKALRKKLAGDDAGIFPVKGSFKSIIVFPDRAGLIVAEAYSLVVGVSERAKP